MFSANSHCSWEVGSSLSLISSPHNYYVIRIKWFTNSSTHSFFAHASSVLYFDFSILHLYRSTLCLSFSPSIPPLTICTDYGLDRCVSRRDGVAVVTRVAVRFSGSFGHSSINRQVAVVGEEVNEPFAPVLGTNELINFLKYKTNKDKQLKS